MLCFGILIDRGSRAKDIQVITTKVWKEIDLHLKKLKDKKKDLELALKRRLLINCLDSMCIVDENANDDNNDTVDID